MLLYIHIPFCASKCGYCSFASLPTPRNRYAPYMRALHTQLKWELERFCSRGEKITSVYIGGGTPSLVDSALFAPLFEQFSPFLDSHAEITIEGNPLSVDNAWARDMRSLGVNRISLGVQSFFEDKLRWLERDHKRDRIYKATEAIHNAGIKRISIDLIYDTPFDTKERIFEEIRQANELAIGHLSAYSLSIEEGSAFYKSGKMNKMEHATGAHYIRSKLLECGFIQYEVSSYAKDHRSYHNLGYWEAKEYLGIGAGAIGRIGNIRYAPYRELERYITEPLWREDEHLSAEDLRFEKIFLGLRSCVGIDKKALDEVKLQALISANKVHENGDKIVASDYFLADEIALYLS